jgi:hypothetical protein
VFPVPPSLLSNSINLSGLAESGWFDVCCALYFAAPLLGLAVAGEIYLQNYSRVYCAKLHHDNDKRSIFHHRHK